MSQPPDQTDIIAANERLTDELATVVSERNEAQAGLEAITRERDDAQANLASVTGERDQARFDLVALTADRDRLAAIDRNFNTRLAAEMAKHGIRADAVAPGAKAPATTDLVALYEALTDPKEKAEFMAKHGAELRRLAMAA